jgi:hypothetical protein
MNNVDSWIDELDDSVPADGAVMNPGINQEAMMGWLIQTYLPKVELPTFSGAPLDWVNFIVKFRDIVHLQQYLSNSQKSHLLFQHLKGDAERSVKSFVNDPRGYVWSLKKLKYLFGQRTDVAKATLERVTKGKAVQHDDLKGLMELFYSITDCLTTLRQLNYESDLLSSDTLRQVLQRLPRSLQMKWGEHSVKIRRNEEPSLIHLEFWRAKKLVYTPCQRKMIRRRTERKETKRSSPETCVTIQSASCAVKLITSGSALSTKA